MVKPEKEISKIEQNTSSILRLLLVLKMMPTYAITPIITYIIRYDIPKKIPEIIVFCKKPAELLEIF